MCVPVRVPYSEDPPGKLQMRGLSGMLNPTCTTEIEQDDQPSTWTMIFTDETWPN